MPLGAFPDSPESNGYPDTHSSVALLLLSLDSGLCRTPFRAISDTFPILSDTIPMVAENCPTSARNTVRYESERCPAEIGTLSDRNWNQCPTDPGIRTDDHIERIVQAYEKFKDESGLARVASLEEIRVKDGNLSIPLYVAPQAMVDSPSGEESNKSLPTALAAWLESSAWVRAALSELLTNGPSPKKGRQ